MLNQIKNDPDKDLQEKHDEIFFNKNLSKHFKNQFNSKHLDDHIQQMINQDKKEVLEKLVVIFN